MYTSKSKYNNLFIYKKYLLMKKYIYIKKNIWKEVIFLKNWKVIQQMTSLLYYFIYIILSYIYMYKNNYAMSKKYSIKFKIYYYTFVHLW